MTYSHSASTLLIAASLFVLAGCGAPEDVDSAPPHFGQPAPTTVEDEPAGARAADGEGTLQLGDDTYEFSVRACDFSGETDDVYQTVSGRGTTADGEPFDVFISRNEVSGILMHTVSFQTGDVRSGDGTVLEAQRMRSGDRWTSIHGDAAEPLIRIDGDRLTASGTFASDATGDSMQGRIEATCNR
jgi:hypothetical protein